MLRSNTIIPTRPATRADMAIGRGVRRAAQEIAQNMVRYATSPLAVRTDPLYEGWRVAGRQDISADIADELARATQPAARAALLVGAPVVKCGVLAASNHAAATNAYDSFERAADTLQIEQVRTALRGLGYSSLYTNECAEPKTTCRLSWYALHDRTVTVARASEHIDTFSLRPTLVNAAANRRLRVAQWLVLKRHTEIVFHDAALERDILSKYGPYVQRLPFELKPDDVAVINEHLASRSDALMPAVSTLAAYQEWCEPS